MLMFKLLSPDTMKVIVFNNEGVEVVTKCKEHDNELRRDRLSSCCSFLVGSCFKTWVSLRIYMILCWFKTCSAWLGLMLVPKIVLLLLV